MTWRRILIYTLLFLFALVAGTYYALTRSGLARGLILDSLAEIFEARLQVQDAEIDPIDGTVRIDNLRLSAKASGGTERKDVLTAPKVVVGVSMNPLSSPGAVRDVLIESAELEIDLGDPTPLDIDALLKTGGLEETSQALPSIRIKDLTLRLRLPGDAHIPLTIGPIQLAIRPDRHNARRLVLTGTCPNPLGGTIAIHGGGDVDKNEFRLVAKADEFVLRGDGIEAFGAEVAAFVKERKLQGRVTPAFWLTYPDANGQLGGGIRAAFTDMQIEPPTVSYLLTHLDGSASITTEDNGTIEVRVDKSGTDMEIEGAVRVSNLSGTDEVEIRAKARGIAINPSLERALSALPAAKRIYAAFRPEGGRADFGMFLHDGVRGAKAGDGGVPRLQLDVDLHDIDMRYDGFPVENGGRRTSFPYPLTRGSGHFTVRDGFVTIDTFEARGVHGGTFRLDGSIDTPRDELDLRIASNDLTFNDDLRAAFATLVDDGNELWQRFAPRGSFGCEVHLFRRPGMDASSFSATIDPDGVSAEWDSFPYRVENLTGEIRVDPDEISFHLRGSRGRNAEFESRGRFLHYGRRHATSEIWVDAKRAVLDTDMRRALSAIDVSFGENWDLFAPSGDCDIEFFGWRPPDTGELSFDLRADLNGIHAMFAPFPVALRDIRGPVVVHGDAKKTRIEILGVTGRGLDARLLFQGELAFDGAKPQVGPITNLNVIAKGVRLSDELVDVLTEQKIISREFWDLTKARGSVDCVFEIDRSAADSDFRQQLIVDLRQVTSEAELLPDKLTRLSGVVRIDNDHVIHLRDLSGYVGESLLTCDRGRVWEEKGDTLMSLELSADRYPIDDRLANLLDGDVKTAYLERNASGHASIAGLSLTLRVPKQRPASAAGSGVSGEFHGAEIRLHNLSLDVGVRVTDISGRVVLDHGRFDHTGSRIEGRLSGLDFLAFGRMFNQARGPFVATHKQLVIPAGDVRFSGGKIASLHPERPGEPLSAEEPLLRFEFGQSRHLDVNIDIQEISLDRLVGDLRTTQRYRGLVSGQVRLGLATADPTSLRAKASIGVSDGYLGDVPIFRSIYGMLRPEKRPNFDSGLLILEAGEGRILIKRLLVLSPLMRVEGKGRLSYDGYLELHIAFPNLFPEASPYTLLPGIVQLLANSLVAYDIAGYVGDTRTGARFVPFEGKPKRRQLAPLPGRAVELPRVFK